MHISYYIHLLTWNEITEKSFFKFSLHISFSIYQANSFSKKNHYIKNFAFVSDVESVIV